MSLMIYNITVDCADAWRLAEFWSGVIGLPIHPESVPEDVEVGIPLPGFDGGELLFQVVPEGKTVKNRVHLCLRPAGARRDAEIDRLLALGAAMTGDHRNPDGTGWAVLADPEGNEFCVLRSAEERAAAHTKAWAYEHARETSADREMLWRLWSDMASWPTWNAGIATIEVDGPFAVGTGFAMTPPDGDAVTMRLTEIVPGESFTDVMDAGDFVVRTVHRLEATPTGTRVVYRTEIDGPAAAEVGPELGPQITADFPDVLDALVTLAERS